MRYEHFVVIESALAHPLPGDAPEIERQSMVEYWRLLDGLANESGEEGLLAQFLEVADHKVARSGIYLIPGAMVNLSRYANALHDPEERHEFVFALMAAIVAEASVSTEGLTPTLGREATAYLSLRSARDPLVHEMRAVIDRADAEARNAAEAASGLIKLQAATQEALNDAGERVRLISDEQKTAAADIETLRSSTNNSVRALDEIVVGLTQRANKLADTVVTTEKGIDAFIASVRETLGQGDTRDLWGRRAKFHQWQFRLSFAIILIMIAGLPALAAYNSVTVIDAIIDINEKLRATSAGLDPAIGTTVALLNRLLVFGFPAALYIWLVKYFIRFNQHSFLLSDDAATRSTIMDMYVKLIASDLAKPEDRGQVMAALLRPTVTQPTDNVELPTSEMLKTLGR